MHITTLEAINTAHLEQLGRTIARSSVTQGAVRYAASNEGRSLDRAARFLIGRSATAQKG